ncbi:MAG TPA: hypothetical protein VNO32_24755 [Candidatus Acidoferrum sp.]|nr:hypothetical protein [Candidatus Acidoferrum sp.]
MVRTNARLARPHGANLFGAIITAVLLITGAWLVDELGEASESCYRPDGGCEASGVRAPAISFDEMMMSYE